jgi:succinate-acetate transporter protein
LTTVALVLIRELEVMLLILGFRIFRGGCILLGRHLGSDADFTAAYFASYSSFWRRLHLRF